MRCVFKFFNVYFILQYSRVSGLGDKDAWLVRCSGCCAISCISLRWLEAFSNHHSPDIVMKYWRRTVNRGTCVLRALCSYMPLAPTILLTTNNSVASTFFFRRQWACILPLFLYSEICTNSGWVVSTWLNPVHNLVQGFWKFHGNFFGADLLALGRRVLPDIRKFPVNKSDAGRPVQLQLRLCIRLSKWRLQRVSATFFQA